MDQDALWLPLLSVDACKRGLAETRGLDLAPDPNAHATVAGAAVDAFFAAMGYFVRSGMSVIAEFSFRRGLAERDLAPYLWTVFDPLALDVPLLRVDTTQGYAPNREPIIAFCQSLWQNRA